MSGEIYNWMKNLAVYYIFLTAILHLIPNSQYEKYIRYFMGMLLILLVTAPVLQLFRLDGTMDEIFQRKILEEEFQTEKWEGFYTDEAQRNFMKEQYEKAICDQVEGYLREKENTKRVQVQLTEDAAKIQCIQIVLTGPKDPWKEEQLKEELSGIYQTESWNIQIFFETDE